MLKLEPQMTIEEELKKNPEVSKQDIQALKDWCQKQPHLPKIEDVHLLLFLHSNYFRMEPTKTTIENFFTVRTHVPEFFANRDPLGSADLRKMMKVVANIPLKLRTKEGYTIMFGKLLNTDPASYDFNVAAKLFFMVGDIWVNMIGTSNGLVYVADATGVSFGHVTRLSIMGLKKMLFYIQEAAPVRLKGIHFINTVPVMETILNMARPFMKKELLNMVHFHSTLKTLEEYMPVEALPNELGGKAGALEELNNAWLKIIDDNREWYIEEESIGRVNESLRIGNAQTAGDLFGVEGSFKKLDID